MEFESSEKTKAPSPLVCVVHDRTGRIVHGHVFIGDGTGMFGPEGRAERERETLEGARRNHGEGVSRLRVFHAPGTLRFDPNVAYRVDTRSGRLVEVPAKPSPKRAKAKTKATSPSPPWLDR
jgi:hypothetical protein